MAHTAYSGFKIKGIADGSLYKARIERSDGSEFEVAGKNVLVWETSQYMDKETAVGQAVYAIDCGRVRTIQ